MRAINVMCIRLLFFQHPTQTQTTKVDLDDFSTLLFSIPDGGSGSYRVGSAEGWLIALYDYILHYTDVLVAQYNNIGRVYICVWFKGVCRIGIL